MRPSNSSNPSEENQPEKGDDLSPGLPQRPVVAHHRLLLDTYIESCQRSDGESVQLITHWSRMGVDDQFALNQMKCAFLVDLAVRLERLGHGDLVKTGSVRFLHPVVSVAPSERKYHWYIDIISADGRCLFVDSKTVTQFENGPASLHLTGGEGESPSSPMRSSRMLSHPAFQEAVCKLISSDFGRVQRESLDYVAFGWILEAIDRARGVSMSRSLFPTEAPLQPIAADEVRNFAWSRGQNPACFECIAHGVHYIAELSLSAQSLQPKVTIFMDVL